MPDALTESDAQDPVLTELAELLSAAIDRTPAGYQRALHTLDTATCEAIAVSQAQAGRKAGAHVGYATHVFARMCGHGTSMIRAAPWTRWVRSDFHDWNVSAVAPHARAILEGYLLFHYLIQTPASELELKCRINVMHLNDCTRRIEMMSDLGAETDGLMEQSEELRDRLQSNDYFNSLPADVRKRCLQGKNLLVSNRDELVAAIGWQKGAFDALYDLLSQHTHILPLSFYRMEPNGRGTGVENEVDRGYIALALVTAGGLLRAATETVVEQFPDVANVRNGVQSEFSPGPISNRRRTSPRTIRRH